MSKAVDIVVGVLAGGVVWLVLSIILTALSLSIAFTPIIIISWIFAALIGGYVSERVGGRCAVVLLAILGPITTWLLGGRLMDLIPLSIAQALFSIILVVVGVAWMGVNVIFVGIGGAIGIGIRFYKSAANPKVEKVRPEELEQKTETETKTKTEQFYKYMLGSAKEKETTPS